MSDGGRDAFVRSGAPKDLFVYQVKFARNPSKQTDPAKWVIDAIKGELDKIRRLVERGMKRYIIMTNMGGTSHPETGTIDKVQAYLDANVTVPTQCWWRDDLDRRLDGAYDLKLHYPSLISGTDAIRLMWELACQGEGAQRRKRALNSYLGHQYEQDRFVRFKQAELRDTPLFNLYVDVPLAPHAGTRKQNKRSIYAMVDAISALPPVVIEESDLAITVDVSTADETYWVRGDSGQARFLYSRDETFVDLEVGATDLLLVSDFARSSPQIVLEGAPGQGKSTLAQYLAQVHRVRMLRNPPDASELPVAHIESPLRFPVKLELRDVAQWIDGINPWAGEQQMLHHQPTSLEGALAGHIHQYSGGVGFDVSDLLALFETAPVLLILDALDEVANLDQRRKVVKEVEACLSRLRQQNIDLQVIITSRPTAIAESPTFSSDQFLYLTLAPLSQELALNYAIRWASTRGLNERDSNELTRILQRKMSAPHMADLAKNTMQLSILLNLIHLRGESLPEQRTELYDTYVDVFFNRESDKSDIVKKHRGLLIDIHRYLGFYLHAKAEDSRTTGRISAEELKSVVSEYLESEHRPVDALDELLTGMVERVVALVSRVEGTYEFEVQPLREYFAARHLYDTASYSPAGHNRTGTKPDRFDGIAPNPYWLNVTRFYAGCYSKGELLDLADRLCELIAALDDASRTYPRRLGVALLQDWVFNQSPKATEKAVDGIFDSFGLRWSTMESGFSGLTGSLGDVNLRLTRDTGAQTLLSKAWEYAVHLPHTEPLANLCKFIRALNLRADVKKLWIEELVNREGGRRDQWIETGSWLAAYSDWTAAELLQLLDVSREDGRAYRLATIARSGIDIEGLPDDVVSDLAKQVLDYPSQPLVERQRFNRVNTPPLMMLNSVTRPGIWMGIVHGRRTRSPVRAEVDDVSGDVQWSRWPTVRNLVRVAQRAMQEEQQDLQAWREITSGLRSAFGKTWSEIEIGVISGSARAQDDAYVRADRLTSDDWSLPDRIRSARRRAGRPDWWLGELGRCADEYDYALWALSAFMWATPATFVPLAEGFNRAVRKLNPVLQNSLAYACRRSRGYSPHRHILRLEQVADFDPMASAMLFNSLDEGDRETLFARWAQSEISSDFIADIIWAFANHQLLAGNLPLDQALELMQRCLNAGARRDVLSQRYPEKLTQRLDAAHAKQIMDDSWSLPTTFVAAAIRAAGNREPVVRPVWQIAQEENWFAD